MNLLDYSATAFPAGFMKNGLPFGITAFAPAHHDHQLLNLASQFGGEEMNETEISAIPAGITPIIVCGAHMEGLVLNHQLTSRDATLWKKTHTAPIYQLYALPPITDSSPPIPPRPALQRVERDGVSIAVEVWLIPTTLLGDFVAQIPAPLGIGKVQLKDGTSHPGFICESIALDSTATPISHLGSWRKFLAQG